MNCSNVCEMWISRHLWGLMTYGEGRQWRIGTRPLRCRSPEACCTPPGASPQSRRHPSSRLRLRRHRRRPGPAACWTAAAWRCGSRSLHLHHWESPLFTENTMQTLRSSQPERCQFSLDILRIFEGLSYLILLPQNNHTVFVSSSVCWALSLLVKTNIV